MPTALDAELRRLAFSFDKDLISAGQGGQQMQVAYHLSLSRFLLRSLADLYPNLPIGGFSELAVFSVKDEVSLSVLLYFFFPPGYSYFRLTEITPFG